MWLDFCLFQVSYQAQKGMTRNAVLKMITVWIAAFLLYGPAILSWEHIAQKSILPEGECHAEFFYNWYFLMIASTIEFFTPFITVTYFNLSIYLNIRKRTSLRKENLSPGQEDCERSFQGEKREHTIFFVKPANRQKHEKSASSCSPPKKACSPPKKASRVSQHTPGNQSLNLNVNQDLPPLQVEVETKSHRSGFYKTTEGIYSTTSRVDMANTMTNRFRLSRDKRVAKSLAIIVCVFGLCWAPYTLLMIIRAACHGHCVQYSFYETSFWLLWVNSAINPILYPLCHMSFRKAFIKLLCPGKAKIHPHIFMWSVKYLLFSGSMNWLIFTCKYYNHQHSWRNHSSEKKGDFSKLFGHYANGIFSSDGALALQCWKGSTTFMASNMSSGSLTFHNCKYCC